MDFARIACRCAAFPFQGQAFEGEQPIVQGRKDRSQSRRNEAVVWEFDDLQPLLTQSAHDVDQVLECHRLSMASPWSFRAHATQ